MNKIPLKLITILSLISPSLSIGEEGPKNPLMLIEELKVTNALDNLGNDIKNNKSILTDIKKSSSSNTCVPSIEKQINQLTTTRGLEDEGYLFKGICKEVEGKFEEAIEFYKKSQKYKNAQGFISYRLSFLEGLKKNCKAAVTLTDEAEWMNFKPKELPLLIKAYCQKELNNPKDAKLTLDKYDQLSPKSASSLAIRKEIISAEINKSSDPGKIRALKEQYNSLLPRMIALEPDNRLYAEQYAKVLLANGHPLNNPSALNQGLSLVRKFTLKDNKPHDTFVLLEIQFLQKQGKNGEALNLLTQIKEKYGLSPSLEFKRLEIETQLNPDKEDS